MGLLIIDKETIRRESDDVNAAFMWLERECHAEIWPNNRSNDRVSSWHVEGVGIPQGEQLFRVTVQAIVPNVLMFGIE